MFHVYVVFHAYVVIHNRILADLNICVFREDVSSISRFRKFDVHSVMYVFCMCEHVYAYHSVNDTG